MAGLAISITDAGKEVVVMKQIPHNEHIVLYDVIKINELKYKW